MSWLRLLSLLVAVAVVVTATPARGDDPGGPFRAKLVVNVAIAKRAASALATIAKKAPPKGLSAEQRKGWSDHSRTLAAAAARFAALKGRMNAVLAKGANAPPSEVAQINFELGTVQQEVEHESSRFLSLSKASRARHEAAMKAMH